MVETSLFFPLKEVSSSAGLVSLGGNVIKENLEGTRIFSPAAKVSTIFNACKKLVHLGMAANNLFELFDSMQCDSIILIILLIILLSR